MMFIDNDEGKLQHLKQRKLCNNSSINPLFVDRDLTISHGAPFELPHR